MSKIVLNDVTNLSSLSVINDNFDKIEQELQNKVHYRDNPEGEPNTFENDVDLNGNSIYNVENLTVANSFTVNGKNIEEVVDDAITSVEQSAESTANSATAAANSAASAFSSAASATASAATATTKASEASTSATNAGNSATAAASSATASASSATAASGSATSATSSASTSTTQAANASSSASASATSATNASNSATASASSATAAASSASAAAASAAAASVSANEAAASAASINDVNLVHKAGTETITGVKTFTQPIYAPMIVTNSSLGFRNRIINGDMRIDQRNNGASVTVTAASAVQYVLDRFYLRGESATGSKVSIQRSTTIPAGFVNSQLVTSLSAYTLGAPEHFGITQAIEGFNIADLAWGTSDGVPVTLSFWVRSSLTGTFGGLVGNSSAAMNYVFSYTIHAANTWEQKTITVPAPPTSTWVTDNGVGIFLTHSIGAGSSITRATGWGAFARSVTGQTSIVGTSGATFYITGVQLEAGTVASPFERRDYGRELMMCQRYYQSGQVISYVSGTMSFTYGSSPFPVAMRSLPTMTFSAGTITSGTAGSVFSLIAPTYFIYSNSSSAAGGIYRAVAEL